MGNICPKCKAEVGDDSRFCSNCGSQIDAPADSTDKKADATLIQPEGQESISFTRTLETPSGGIIPGGTFALRYKIDRELGRGGMGIVYKAEDLKLKRSVALKFLPPELLGSAEAKERFLREAQAAAALSHPNICTIHEVDEAEGKTYISMAYVEGYSLRDRIKEGPIDVMTGLALAIQAAEGLAAAHKKGIVHRDIKSANIMVDGHGQAKIMDFGLAKTSGSTMITREGVTMGTVAYMSPEQAQGKTVDHRTDIWSLGVVLYEMFCGKLPFGGENQASFLYAIVHEEPKPIKALNPDIPIEIQKVIARALKKKPQDRYQSAGDMAAELRKYQDRLKAEESGLFSLRTLWRRLRRPQIAIPAAVILIALVALTIWQLNRQAKIRWAREVALPEIQQLCTDNDFTPAFYLALDAQKYIAEDPEFADIWEEVSGKITISTDPAGATVQVKDYAFPEREWELLGNTPLTDKVSSRSFKRVKITKPGYEDFYAALYCIPKATAAEVTLDPEGSLPEGMVHINAATYRLPNITVGPNFPFRPSLYGFENMPRLVLGEYYLDKYEVSNKEYKAFVDAGGYREKSYWMQAFIDDSRTLSWDEAMALFVDKTGRHGPSTWELGDYPDGQGDYPVRGVSWYEAAAYAEYAGKRLPTHYHWNFAGGIADSVVGGFYEASYVLPQSNFGSDGPKSRGQSTTMSPHGVYDLSGNVKEWCWNAEGENRIILGGAWDDPSYMSIRIESAPPIQREHNFGFRCMMPCSEESGFERASKPLPSPSFPDFSRFETCSDEVFAVLKSLYDYVPTPLEPKIESRMEWDRGVIREEVTFNATYGGERMTAYVFLPEGGTPPYQVMVFYPGGGAFMVRSLEEYTPRNHFSWLVRSNRAVVFPVYKGALNRPFEPVEKVNATVLRDRDVKGMQDMRRTIDYLETRPEDFDMEKIGFYGTSTGATWAAVVPAIDERIKATILSATGLGNRLDHWSPFHFCPRVKVPVLYIVGKYDTRLPIDIRVKPLLDLFGTPEEDKHLKIYETGHAVWQSFQWKADCLDFLDRYFGPAK